MEGLANTISIIRGEPKHSGVVLSLLQEAARWMELNGIKQWTPGQFNEIDIAGYFSDRHIYLAIEDQDVVGMFTLQFSDFQYWGSKNDESYAYLHRLTVKASHRSQGLGPYLLKYAVKLAKDIGCKGLRFDTVAHNIKLNRYYQSLGYHYMGTNDMGNGRLVNLYEHFKEKPDSERLIIRYTSEADFVHLKEGSISPEYLEAANHPALSEHLLFSAVHEATQRFVGYICISEIDRVNRSARINKTIVDPQLQGRGYEGVMLHEMLRIGFDSLDLQQLRYVDGEDKRMLAKEWQVIQYS